MSRFDGYVKIDTCEKAYALQIGDFLCEVDGIHKTKFSIVLYNDIKLISNPSKVVIFCLTHLKSRELYYNIYEFGREAVCGALNDSYLITGAKNGD